LQVVSLRLFTDVADAVLVVNASPVPDDALVVQNAYCGSPLRADSIGNLIGQILEQRKADVMDARERRNLGNGILNIGIEKLSGNVEPVFSDVN